MLPESYQQFYKNLLGVFPESHLIRDPLRTLAYGTDASFYRLIPKIVIKAETEQEVSHILKTADRLEIPVTFRAAGTSLSGQAITDSVLVIAGSSWKNHTILENGAKIRLQPGVIGGRANQYLAPYGMKIGPDPASINAAMIGGIAANNASGMCCGTAQNSYRTLSSMRIIFQDGTLLDTANPQSRSDFSASHGQILDAVTALARRVRADDALSARIRHKFRIKNTTGYSLNALVDFQDPFEIIQHLMIGSEGTLGFIAEIVYHTVVEHSHKASALMLFQDMSSACQAVIRLKEEPVSAVELMDRASLRAVEAKQGMPAYLKPLGAGATALLVETRAEGADALQNRIETIVKVLKDIATLRPIEFTADAQAYTRLWDIRKGLFPAVGAVRKIGTTVIIEDVAFPVPQLARATLELQELLARYRYHEAIIFGHALEGNLHFVFTQDFNSPQEVDRYREFMQEVCEMVVQRYDGSLKAEHGTGRNMAPFVEMEWGKEAYGLMQVIKTIFDPKNLLNPGVILNANPHAHIENLKPLPETHAIVDKCIECGFCEVNCPSRDLTLTPRQRIVIRREISRLQTAGQSTARLRALEMSYVYQGEQTCAADGLCAMSCPVSINTGELTKELRRIQRQKSSSRRVAAWAVAHFDTVARGLRIALVGAHMAHTTLGSSAMLKVAKGARKLSADRLPLWNRFMPRAVPEPRLRSPVDTQADKVVYFPSCIARTMGPAWKDPDGEPLYRVTQRVLQRAGYEVVYPDNLRRLCCGTPFESKGFIVQADRKAAELQLALLNASCGGRYPILCDTSPCLYRMRQFMRPELRLFEPVEFIYAFLTDKLSLQAVAETIAIHHTCSTIKMGLESKFLSVAQACAETVIVPEDVGCCGFAGDRGFNFPELNESALKKLAGAVSGICTAGYSTSRTCEIGLSLHSGIFYKSIMYLIDRCTAYDSRWI